MRIYHRQKCLNTCGCVPSLSYQSGLSKLTWVSSSLWVTDVAFWSCRRRSRRRMGRHSPHRGNHHHKRKLCKKIAMCGCYKDKKVPRNVKCELMLTYLASIDAVSTIPALKQLTCFDTETKYDAETSSPWTGSSWVRFWTFKKICTWIGYLLT